jgi:hypothetical protein
MSVGLDPIKFGTSGWRARIADTYTFANVRRLTRAIADHLKETGDAPHGVVVGYDTRFLSEDFAAAAAGTLAQAGVRSRLAVAAVPTPTVAHAVIHHRAAAGITITASLNPAPDNGLKLSGPTGGPASPEVTHAVEARVAAVADPGGTPIAEARAAGLVESADFAPPYLDQCRRMVDLDRIRAARLRVVVDVMYGPARGYLDRLLEEAGCEVTLLHGARDVMFGGHPPEPAEEYLGELISRYAAGAHLGLATTASRPVRNRGPGRDGAGAEPDGPRAAAPPPSRGGGGGRAERGDDPLAGSPPATGASSTDAGRVQAPRRLITHGDAVFSGGVRRGPQGPPRRTASSRASGGGSPPSRAWRWRR